MKALFKLRLGVHMRLQMKYLQRVFNDHFVLVLLILLGAMLYSYSRLVADLQPTWWLAPLLAAIATTGLVFGDFASLVERADAIFLLPQTASFSQYLFRARRYSLLLPVIWLVLLSIALAPLIGVIGDEPLLRAALMGAGLLALKDIDLWWRLLRFYPRLHPLFSPYSRLAAFAVVFVALALGLWTHPVWFAIGAVAANLAFRLVIVVQMKPQTLNWLSLVQNEEKRAERIYRFYNLFTDVPGLGGGVHRFRWLDGIVKLLNVGKQSPWRYLFARGFVRRSAYFGLYLRLWLIGTLILSLLSQWWLALLLTALFVYLVGFQLMPLAEASEEIVFTHLYPLPATARQKAFTSIMRRILVLFGLLLALGPLLAGRFVLAALTAAAGVAMAVLFTELYLPLRIRARAKKS